MEALLTRQSDALTSPSEWLVFFFFVFFFHLLLFSVPSGCPTHPSVGVAGGCDCLEMKSKRAVHDWNPRRDSGCCLSLLTRKHHVRTAAFRRDWLQIRKTCASKLDSGQECAALTWWTPSYCTTDIFNMLTDDTLMYFSYKDERYGQTYVISGYFSRHRCSDIFIQQCHVCPFPVAARQIQLHS